MPALGKENAVSLVQAILINDLITFGEANVRQQTGQS
jgi:hypothetical protein